MGLQKLSLAIAALVVARIATLYFAPNDGRANNQGFFQPSQPEQEQTADRIPPDSPFAYGGGAAPAPFQDGDPSNPVGQDPNAAPPFNIAKQPSDASGKGCTSVKSAVVTIHAGREIGSGSIVSKDGLVITNYHVVQGVRGAGLYVKTDNGQQISGQVIAGDRMNDLALIRLQNPGNLPVVPVAASGIYDLGQSVCAVGSPFGQAGVVTQGRLVRVLPNGDLQSDVTLKPGNSGGPLINSRGEMIGVNKGVARSNPGAPNSDRVSYATSASVAKGFIQQNRANQPGQGVDSFANSPSPYRGQFRGGYQPPYGGGGVPYGGGSPYSGGGGYGGYPYPDNGPPYGDPPYGAPPSGGGYPGYGPPGYRGGPEYSPYPSR